MSDVTRAVFLGQASQDAKATRRTGTRRVPRTPVDEAGYVFPRIPEALTLAHDLVDGPENRAAGVIEHLDADAVAKAHERR